MPETLAKKGRWKVKWSSLLIGLASYTCWYMLFPFVFLGFIEEILPAFSVDSKTFLLVFLVLWIRKMIREIISPPRVWVEESESPVICDVKERCSEYREKDVEPNPCHSKKWRLDYRSCIHRKFLIDKECGRFMLLSLSFRKSEEGREKPC